MAAGSGRWQQWEVAGGQFRQAPLVGTGAGDYRFEWAEERPIEQAVVNAHSLYLELLGESGLVGLLLWLVPLGVGVWGGIRLTRRGPPWLTREVAVAGAAFLTLALHMAGDWDWQLPAVVIPAVVLGGAAIRASAETGVDAPEDGFDRGPFTRLAIATVALLGVLVLAGPTLSARAVDAARAEARGGDLVAALAQARSAVERDPSNPSARLLEANLLSDLGADAQADLAYREALRRSPKDWVIAADWAASLAARGRNDAAAARLARAQALNPLEPRLRFLGESLVPSP